MIIGNNFSNEKLIFIELKSKHIRNNKGINTKLKIKIILLKEVIIT